MKIVFKCWRRNFLIIEAIVALLVSAAFAGWFYYLDGNNWVNNILDKNRAPVYGAMASIFGSLLGFVITATSVVLGLSVSEKLHTLKNSKEYTELWKIFTSTIRVLGITTIVSLICLLVDKDTSPVRFLVPLIFLFTVLSILRIIRTIWALENIIFLVVKK